MSRVLMGLDAWSYNIVPFDRLQSAGRDANPFGVNDRDVAGGLVLQSGVCVKFKQEGESASDE